MGEKGGENKEETRGIKGEIEKNGDRWWPRRNGEKRIRDGEERGSYVFKKPSCVQMLPCHWTPRQAEKKVKSGKKREKS